MAAVWVSLELALSPVHASIWASQNDILIFDATEAYLVLNIEPTKHFVKSPGKSFASM
jgi:hypothetical protein